LEVVQYIKDTFHEGKCEIAAIGKPTCIFWSLKVDYNFYELNVFLNFQAEDGKLMADPETGEFWGFFGGFAPLPRKAASDNDKSAESHSPKLLRYNVVSVFPLIFFVSGCTTILS